MGPFRNFPLVLERKKESAPMGYVPWSFPSHDYIGSVPRGKQELN